MSWLASYYWETVIVPFVQHESRPVVVLLALGSF